jgi:NAD-dependent SIR2 family protein deacetylase
MRDRDAVAADGRAIAHDPAASAERLVDFLGRHPRVLVLTGAGCSTASGIPAYRDREGAWAHRAPMQFADFIASHTARRRYWARSFAGWSRFSAAVPGPAHRSLAALERLGRVTGLVTQNVDGLHGRAGSERVIDLHGRLDTVVCLGCRRSRPRQAFQQMLAASNPLGPSASASRRPDGDVELEDEALASFVVPDCDACGGVLKPDVVFFGEAVPKARVAACFAALEAADGLLVVGSSLMVRSGYRFVCRALETGRTVLVLNAGRTRADADGIIKVDAECGETLAHAVPRLVPVPAPSPSALLPPAAF